MVKLVRHSNPWHLRQIQIAPESQGQGVGRRVLEQLLEEARSSSASIVLNVLKVNPAHALYTALGFRVVEENERAYEMQWRP